MPTEGKTYTFRGRTFAETYQKVAKTLGKDALIIEKREIKGRKGPLSGLLGGDLEIEIVAAPAAAGAPQKPAEPEPQPESNLLRRVYCPPARKEGEQPSLLALARENLARGATRETVTLTAGGGMAARLEAIEKRLGEIEHMREEVRGYLSLHARGGMPGVGNELMDEYARLVENDVAGDIARGLVEKVQRELPAADVSSESVRAALCEAVARIIGAGGPVSLKESGPTVVALVGPTGAGKTTTVLKLAFDFAVRKGRRVAVVTEDTRRPGAREQLRSLEQFLGLPVAAADTPEKVERELALLRDRDLILVDTAGRSPRNRKLLDGLGAFLTATRPDETHLVISGDCSERSMMDITASFGSVGYNRIVLSKLDEAASYGLILNVAARVAGRLSYITTGQEYMETVEAGDGERLARLVLGIDTVSADGGGLNLNGGR